MPFFLKTHYMESYTTVENANKNLANYIRFYDNLRDPLVIDQLTSYLYRCFHDAEMLISEYYHVGQFIFAKNEKPMTFGRDLFE